MHHPVDLGSLSLLLLYLVLHGPMVHCDIQHLLTGNVQYVCIYVVDLFGIFLHRCSTVVISHRKACLFDCAFRACFSPKIPPPSFHVVRLVLRVSHRMHCMIQPSYLLTATVLPFPLAALGWASMPGSVSISRSGLTNASVICFRPSTGSCIWSRSAAFSRYSANSAWRSSVSAHSLGNTGFVLKRWCRVSRGTSAKVSEGSCHS